MAVLENGYAFASVLAAVDRDLVAHRKKFGSMSPQNGEPDPRWWSKSEKSVCQFRKFFSRSLHQIFMDTNILA